MAHERPTEFHKPPVRSRIGPPLLFAVPRALAQPQDDDLSMTGGRALVARLLRTNFGVERKRRLAGAHDFVRR